MAATIEVKCERCQRKFLARVADRKRGWGRFCSKSCKAIKQEQQTGQFQTLQQFDPDDEPMGEHSFYH